MIPANPSRGQTHGSDPIGPWWCRRTLSAALVLTLTWPSPLRADTLKVQQAGDSTAVLKELHHAGLEEPSTRSLRDLAWQIIDLDAAKTRRPADWSKLHRAFFERLQRGPGDPDPLEEQVRRAVVDYLDRTIGPEIQQHLGTRPAGHSPLEYLLGASRGYGRDSRFQPKLLSLAGVVVRLFEACRVDREQGSPREPASLDETLPLPDYLRRYQGWLRQQEREAAHLAVVPSYFAGFLFGPEPHGDRRSLGEPTPFGLVPVLTARLSGLEPAIRSFPELTRWLVDYGVVAVEFLTAAPANPPALLIHFHKPFRDRHSGAESSALAVAVLRDPWPALPILDPQRPWSAMTEDEFLQAAEQALSQERVLVEFNEEVVRGLTFRANDPLGDRVARMDRLVHLALQGRLAPRSDYQLYSEEGVRRLARWLGRDPQERRGLESRLRVELNNVSQLFKRAPATETVRHELAERFAQWKQPRDTLLRLGLPQLEGIPDAHEWATILVRHDLVQLGPAYAPLLRLFFRQRHDGTWLIHREDAKTLANRLQRFQQVLTAARPRLQALKVSLPGPDWAIFMAELNLGLLRALPLNPGTPFPRNGLSLDEAQLHLVALCREAFGADVDRSPSALRWQQAERSRVEDAARTARAQLLEAFPGDPVAMAEALATWEDAAERLRALGPPRSSIPALPTPTSVEQFAEFLDALPRWLAELPRALAAAAPVVHDAVSRDLLQALVESARLADAGKFHEAVAAASALLTSPGRDPDAASKVRPWLQQWAGRLIEDLTLELQTLPADAGSDVKDGLYRRIQAVVAMLRDVPGLVDSARLQSLITAAEPIMPEAERRQRVRQRRAVELLHAYHEEFARDERGERQLRVAQQFLITESQGEPFDPSRRAKLASRLAAVSRRTALTGVLRAIAELDPSLLEEGQRALSDRQHGGLEEGPVGVIVLPEVAEMAAVVPADRPLRVLLWEGQEPPAGVREEAVARLTIPEDAFKKTPMVRDKLLEEAWVFRKQGVRRLVVVHPSWISAAHHLASGVDGLEVVNIAVSPSTVETALTRLADELGAVFNLAEMTRRVRQGLEESQTYGRMQ